MWPRSHETSLIGGTDTGRAGCHVWAATLAAPMPGDPRGALPVPSATRPNAARAWSWLLSHPVPVSFAIAVALRAIVATVVAFARGGALFVDDATYSQIARIAAEGRLHTLGVETEFLYERTGVLLVPVTALYRVFGPHALAGQLYVALLGAATAALVARLALEVAARPWALGAGMGVALL